MSDRLRGPGLEACPQCGESKRNYPQHWNRSASCDYPPIDEPLHHVVAGALLGDGSLEGTERPKVRVVTTTRTFALWLYTALGPLAAGVRRYDRDDPESDVYRVATIAHPDLERYRDWYHDGEKQVPERVRLRQLSALVFYACDGSLTFSGPDTRPRITFKATDDEYRETLTETLSRLEIGLTPQPASDHVAIGTADVRRFLEWIGDPVPGKEHKWCLEQDVYRVAKRRIDDGEMIVTADMDRSERYRALVRFVADGTDADRESFDRDTFDAVLARPTADVVADSLGGGSWPSALRVANVLLPANPPKSSGTSNLSLATVVDALETAAARADDTLTMDAYDDHRDPAHPAASTIAHTFGWNTAKRAALLEIPSGTGKGHGPVSRQQAIEAVETVAPRTDGTVTVRSYDDYRDDDHPAGYTIAERFGWDTIKQAADVETSAGRGTASVTGSVTKAQAIDALETVAARVDRTLTIAVYDDRRDPDHPAATTISRKFGWTDIKREVGLED